MSNVLVRWSGTEQGPSNVEGKYLSRLKRWKINEIFRWDGKMFMAFYKLLCNGHPVKAAAPATYDSLMGIKGINFRMVFGLKNLIYAF
jgi:hypothetical protein